MMNYITTESVYRIGLEYREERKQKHCLIIKRKTKNRESRDPATAVLVGGGSGSGKSFFVQKLFLNDTDENYVLIDADNIKEELPEYTIEKEKNNPYAADIVHDESGYIASSLVDFCIEHQYSFIYDGTMSNYDKYQDIFAKLHNANYQISGMFVDIDVNVALERAKERAAIEKRFVPEDVVVRTNAQSPINFKLFMTNFKEIVMFNNTKNLRGSKPEIAPFFVQSNGMEQIYIREQYNLFMEKANK